MLLRFHNLFPLLTSNATSVEFLSWGGAQSSSQCRKWGPPILTFLTSGYNWVLNPVLSLKHMYFEVRPPIQANGVPK